MGDLQALGYLVAGDACGFGRLAGRDFGFLDVAGSGDLEVLRFPFASDAFGRDFLLLGDALFFGSLAGGDLGRLDGAGTFDFAPPGFFLVGDTGIADGALLSDARLLDLLVGGNLGVFDSPGAFDFALLGFLFIGDAGFGDGAFLLDARGLDLLAGGNLGLLGLGFLLGAFAHQICALGGPAGFDFALLFEASGLALALDLEDLLFGFQVAASDPHHGVLLDVVAEFAPRFDFVDQLGQALGVEPVGRVEELEIGLVQLGDGDGFELETVLGQGLGSGRPDA